MTAVAAVLSYNRPDLAQMMARQLGESLWVFENGSQKQAALPCHTYLLGHNHFFSGGWNRAMQVLIDQGYNWVWMLNSDVQGVDPGMLDELAQTAARLDHLAALSPTFNSPHPHMQPQKNNRLGLRTVRCRRIMLRPATAVVHRRRDEQRRRFPKT